jgi:hypothetical protein
MAYWALYPRPCPLDVKPTGDAFVVCELPFFEEMVIPPELFLHIYDERNEVDIIAYNFKRISAGEFDYFLAFECGPEAKSICGDDDEHSRLYILK